MVIFSKTWLSGLGRDQTNIWENIFINYIENNWTLQVPPKYHPVSAKHGVLFGSDYKGEWDFVASAVVTDNAGTSSDMMSVGGRHDKNVVYITFIFSVRNYSIQQGDEIPIEVHNVSEFIENLIERNPRGLQNEGIRHMDLENIYDGEVEMYGQQIYEMRFIVKCLISRINLE